MHWKPLCTNKYIHIMHLKQTIPMPGPDPGFQVRGGALRKIAPSGGRRENFHLLLSLRYSLTFMQYACKVNDCPDLSKSNLYNNNLIHDNMHFTFLFAL
jgi:hypothetical protein